MSFVDPYTCITSKYWQSLTSFATVSSPTPSHREKISNIPNTSKEKKYRPFHTYSIAEEAFVFFHRGILLRLTGGDSLGIQ